jgi:hypothetical protein
MSEQGRPVSGGGEVQRCADPDVDRLAHGLDDITRQLRSMGERGEPGFATDLVRQAADGTQQLAERYRRGGIDDAVGQLRDFGRNRPGLLLAGAFGLGVATGVVARDLAQILSGDVGEQREQRERTPAEAPAPGPERPGATPGGRPPPIWADATDDGGAYAVPASGHAAYGAPVSPYSDEQWGA